VRFQFSCSLCIHMSSIGKLNELNGASNHGLMSLVHILSRSLILYVLGSISLNPFVTNYLAVYGSFRYPSGQRLQSSLVTLQSTKYRVLSRTLYSSCLAPHRFEGPARCCSGSTAPPLGLLSLAQRNFIRSTCFPLNIA
jgi:hypothetical protein